jgi:SAM-dependent methyltransferase
MKSGVAQRVLFLVDRRALAAQAVRAFKSFEPEPALKFDQIYELYSQKFKREDFDEDEKFDPTVLQEGYLTNPQPGHAFVYVCTIQRLAMNLFGRQAGFGFGEVESGDEDADQIDIPIHAFDLIVADECHRGYTGQELSIWRDTLNHFDAIRIGLTSNKQLNFVQHILTVLKPGGRAAVVLPDNCLFADQAGEVFKILTEDCDLHTVLRLPRGTFTPYSQGVKANVVFFTKGYPTDRTWIYDARSNVPGITKKDRPLAPEHFTEFEKCFGADANGKSKRKESDSPASTKGYLGGNRWRCFSIADVKARDFKLDSFKWLKDDSLEDADELPPPEELATDAIGELDAAVEELNAVLALLENGAVK